MATKGYNSYHGRMSGGKIALIVALALVLVGAVAYLTLQNYVVYDEAGNARLELPFLHRKDKEEPDDQTILGNGELQMDTRSHTVTMAGEPVQLTLKEFDILHLLMNDPGRVFTREQLLDLIWGVDFLGESRTVDVHIATLRNKLGEVGQAIVTVRGVGYKMERLS